jgi:hypothetical protein
MRPIALFCASAIIVAACSSDSDDGGVSGAQASGGFGGGAGFAGSAGANPGGSGGASGIGATGGVGGMQMIGTGGMSAGGSGGGGSGGSVSGGAGGVAGMMTGGMGGMTGGMGGMMAPGTTEPIIPEISGECPTFSEGQDNVSLMGITATVFAGPKKEGTGSLLFYYYGTGRTGRVSTMLPRSVIDQITAEGGIVWAPNSALNTGGDCSGTGTFGIDDFNVADQVVACAVKNYGIDPKRIYATGCSAGGLTTGCMGIMRSNYMAAVAPNSGGVTIGYGDLQNPNWMPSSITMNGGAGDNVIVNFGNTSEGYSNYVLKYGGFAVNCIHNTGHCGAGAALYESAWQFLKDHPYGTKPSPYAGGLPSGFHASCEVFEMTDMAPIGGF